ncbi:MAG: hypothetical protein ACR2NN_09990 [Bryobacteraceae bacterium]
MLQHLLPMFIPWAPFALFTCALTLCLFTFQSFKQETRALKREVMEKQTVRERTIQALQADVEALKRGLREAEDRAGLLVAPAAPRSGFNISKRSQALRMSRLGENSENISAALSLPRREVDLLLKVQKIVIGNSGRATS